MSGSFDPGDVTVAGKCDPSAIKTALEAIRSGGCEIDRRCDGNAHYLTFRWTGKRDVEIEFASFVAPEPPLTASLERQLELILFKGLTSPIAADDLFHRKEIMRMAALRTAWIHDDAEPEPTDAFCYVSTPSPWTRADAVIMNQAAAKPIDAQTLGRWLAPIGRVMVATRAEFDAGILIIDLSPLVVSAWSGIPDAAERLRITAALPFDGRPG